jgi:hypothetical protein
MPDLDRAIGLPYAQKSLSQTRNVIIFSAWRKLGSEGLETFAEASSQSLPNPRKSKSN